MESHRDDDATVKGGALEGIAQLIARAERMTERGENRITAGAPGEVPLEEYREGLMTVRRLPDDPAALRVSLGELRLSDAPRESYCAYRGSKNDVITLLRRALQALGPIDA